MTSEYRLFQDVKSKQENLFSVELADASDNPTDKTIELRSDINRLPPLEFYELYVRPGDFHAVGRCRWSLRLCLGQPTAVSPF